LHDNRLAEFTGSGKDRRDLGGIAGAEYGEGTMAGSSRISRIARRNPVTNEDAGSIEHVFKTCEKAVQTVRQLRPPPDILPYGHSSALG
jgi:hypothetical protein